MSFWNNDFIKIKNSNDPITLSTGDGRDKVTIKNQNGAVSIDTGKGNDFIKLHNVDGNVSIEVGSGNDKVFIKDVDGDLNIDTGSGNDKVNIDNLNGNINLDLGSGNDVANIKNITGNISVDAGSGSDLVITKKVNGDVNIKGGSGSDKLFASGNNNYIEGGSGIDFIYGNHGTTTAIFSGLSTEYKVIDFGALVVIMDKVHDRDSIDVLLNVELYQFSNGTFTVDELLNPQQNTPPTVEVINTINTLDENTDTSNAIKVADIQITDLDGGANALSLSGADAADFEIIGTELYLKAGTNLDYESKTQYDVTVNVDDATLGGTPDDSVNYTLAINNLNDVTATIALNNQTSNLDENTDTSNAIKVADIQITDLDGGANALSLSGADAADFEIIGTELYLKAGTNLDYESKTQYDVTVNIDDATLGGTPDDSVNYTLAINNLNDAPNYMYLLNHLVINGIDTDDRSGSSVSGAGDVNGDGFDDVIIGASNADPDGTSNAGESYVVFGKANGYNSEINLSSLDGSNGFVINGIDANDQSGSSVSAAGDINGDGIDDIIVGAYLADPDGKNNAGESYVVFGQSGAFSAELNLSDLDGSNGFKLNGIDAGDNFGVSVSGGGDINGDGIDDIIVGAYLADTVANYVEGETYVIFGKTIGFGSEFDVANLNGTNGFKLIGIDRYDNSSASISHTGDINDDGFDDIIIGAPNGEPNGNGNAGESYVVFGNSNGFSASLNLSNLDGSNGFTFNGIDAGDRSGYFRSVSGAGDVNGDGIDDVIIGAYQADPNDNENAGESYVVFGQSTAFNAEFNLSSLNGSNGFRINGIDEFDLSGISVSSAGDVNGDGFDDVIIGAINADPNGNSIAGESYVVFGKASGFNAELNLSDLDGDNGFKINGIDTDDRSGRSVSGAGDVNGDGFDDVIIGAINADPDGTSNAGESYFVFGRDTFDATIELSELQMAQVDENVQGAIVGEIIVEDPDVGNVHTFTVSDNRFEVVNGQLKLKDTESLDYETEQMVTVDVTATDLGGLQFTKSFDINVNNQILIFPSFIAPNGLDGTNGFEIRGISSGDRSGFSVDGIADVNNDGIDDIIVGAHKASPDGNALAGQSYVVFGGQNLGGSFELSDLLSINGGDGTKGFVINGLTSSDELGYTVSTAADVNNDGIHDVIIGARNADGDGNNRGEAYVIFGQNSFASEFDLNTLNGSNGFEIKGISNNDEFATEVNSAGDINNDGIDDIIIGAINGDPGGRSNAGESYVIFGQNSFNASFDLTTLNGTNGFQVNGQLAGDRSGLFVSSAGDFNNDGIDDLFVSAKDANNGGEAYIIFGGQSFNSDFELSAIDGTNGYSMRGVINDNLGFFVSNLGDINGDNIDDVAVGANGTDSGAGRVYVLFGGQNLGVDFNLAQLLSANGGDGSQGFVIDSLYGNLDQFGISGAGLGDVNEDGIGDMIFGAAFADGPGGNSSGQGYVIFGQDSFSAEFDLNSLNGSNGFRIDGANSTDFLADSVSVADFNNDSHPDIILGASDANASAGLTYVLYADMWSV